MGLRAATLPENESNEAEEVMGAKFMKAKPQQARLKVSMYGPPGAGKTFSALLMAEGLAKVRGKRIAYVDTERGTDFYAQAVKDRKVHPEAFDFDALYERSIAEVSSAVFALDPKEHGIVVLDSISHLWEAAMDAYAGKKTKIDSIPMHAWGKIKKPYKDLIKFLIASPFDVFILGRQKNLFENDDDSGEMKKVGVAMRAEGETAYEPHICVRMEARINPEKTTQSVYVAYVEKDRTGVLAGRSIVNPSFATIEPLLPLLGEVQAPAEDEEERIAKDGELLAKGDEKAAAKEAKSLDLFRSFQAEITVASDLAGLSQVAEQIKKSKRYLVDEHESALREVYRARRDTLVGEAAPVL
jgi:hypothetical protein